MAQLLVGTSRDTVHDYKQQKIFMNLCIQTIYHYTSPKTAIPGFSINGLINLFCITRARVTQKNWSSLNNISQTHPFFCCNIPREAKLYFVHADVGNLYLGVPILFLSLTGNHVQYSVYINDINNLLFLLLKTGILLQYYTNNLDCLRSHRKSIDKKLLIGLITIILPI